MRIVVGWLLVAAFQCGPRPSAPGSGSPSPEATAPVGSVERLLAQQPPTICEGWSPAPEADLMEASQVVARADHACVRITSGRVRCWGANANGELGTCEDLPHSAVPQTFAGVESARDVAVSRHGTCVVDEAGQLWCTQHIRGLLGAEGPGRIEGVEGAVAVAVGDDHACAQLGDGRVLCFGRWDAAETLGPRAQLVDEGRDTGRGAGYVELRQPQQLVAGAAHTCALEGQGRVMCWGQNALGQLGDPETAADLDTSRGTPRRVAGLPFVASIHAEQDTNCAVTDVGEVFCWGQGFGPKAMGVRVPQTRDAAMGPGFVCLATRAGTLWCGGESMTFAPDLESGALRGYDDTVGVAVGNGFVCAHRKDGMVQCQGANDRGQLGGMHSDQAQWLKPSKVLMGGVAI